MLNKDYFNQINKLAAIINNFQRVFTFINSNGKLITVAPEENKEFFKEFIRLLNDKSNNQVICTDLSLNKAYTCNSEFLENYLNEYMEKYHLN